MRTRLSVTEYILAVIVTALLCAPQALAQISDYSTDTEEPDIMTVKNDHCCDNQHLKDEANIQIHLQHNMLTTYKKANIQVLDAKNEEVAHVITRDKVVYMHLPEGQYTIKVNALGDHSMVQVHTTDEGLTDYTL